jgi:hypothetical protein
MSPYKYRPQQIASTRPWLPTRHKGKTCWAFRDTYRRVGLSETLTDEYSADVEARNLLT